MIFLTAAGHTEMLSSSPWQALTLPLHPIDDRFAGFSPAHSVSELHA